MKIFHFVLKHMAFKYSSFKNFQTLFNNRMYIYKLTFGGFTNVNKVSYNPILNRCISIRTVCTNALKGGHTMYRVLSF